MPKPKIHVVGCGQVGAMMSNFFLKRHFPVSIYECKNKTPHAQIPWGWMRRMSLQQMERLQLPLCPLDLPQKHISKGPMVISTASEARLQKWKEWLRIVDTDARLLTANEARDFDIEEKYNLLCDSQDYLFDFNQYKLEVIKTLQSQTDWIGESSVKRFVWKNNFIEGIILQNGQYHSIEKDAQVLLCVGNQTKHFLPVPMAGITLQYRIVSKNIIPPKPYVAHWTDDRSIQYFKDYVKVGCGMNGTISSIPPMAFWSNFFHFLWKQNYSWQNATTIVTEHWQLDNNPFESCEVDITPDFLPIVQPIGNNLTVICGLSGSGFTVYEPWFQEHVKNIMLREPGENQFRIDRKFGATSFLY